MAHLFHYGDIRRGLIENGPNCLRGRYRVPSAGLFDAPRGSETGVGLLNG